MLLNCAFLQRKIEPTKPRVWSLSCLINNLDWAVYTGFGALSDSERLMALVSLAYRSVRWSTRQGTITELGQKRLGFNQTLYYM